MVSKAISTGPWPPEPIAGLPANVARDNAAAAPSTPDEATPGIELSSADAWCELIRDIVSMASDGGGRIVIRCSSGDSEDATERVFWAPIKSVARITSNDPALAKSAASANLQPVRIVTDPNAPALQPQDVDRLYPWRQKDLLRELNDRLGRRMLNSYDIQAVRRQHKLDDRPDFVFNLPGAGRRYSPAVAEWIMAQQGRNPEFFHEARTADHETMKLRRHKPR